MQLRQIFITSLVLASSLAISNVQMVWAAGPHDHDRARKAVEAEEVLPLKSVLERVERDYPGQVMEVELDRENGRWVYEIKILQPGGALLKLKADARDGTVLGTKERPKVGEKP